MGEEQKDVMDARMEFLQEYSLKTMKLKPDKWAKMMSQEESTVMLMDYLEKAETRFLCIFVNQQGQMMPTDEFPTVNKAKAVYFVKRKAEVLKKENLKDLIFGDMSYAPLDHLTSLVDAVSCCLLQNTSSPVDHVRLSCSLGHGSSVVQQLQSQQVAFGGVYRRHAPCSGSQGERVCHVWTSEGTYFASSASKN